ncbi:hypothetical protein L1049_018858 [Liquidambar formosana]|uniref:Protein kinase domain-containing protein n=1 Tax=Liquidambar formosana TaxID=63359 RepID=A0AAP0WMS4_LIQFO
MPASSFAGNKHLCGRPLPLACLNKTAENESEQIRVPNGRRKKTSDRMVLVIIGIDVAMALAIAGIVTCSITCYWKKRRRSRERKRELKRYDYGVEREEEGELVCFEGCKGFAKVDELLKASAEMLGKGSVGTTYKVLLDGGDVVVVKRVREWRRKKEIHGLLREIGGLRHFNIVSLRAFYCSKDELLLVYDFLPNGSLHSLLHGDRGPGRTPLDWTTRLKLASSAAQGLAFLHSYNKSKLFHGHLTSSNIIVDHSGNACIADTGLHQLLPAPSSSNNAYKSPEQMHNNTTTTPTNKQQRKFLQKCDVYSFGVILLEILTGKMPAGEGETSLVKWVQRVVREEWTWEVFDFELLRYKEMEGEMMALLNVALLCLTTVPSDRPKMGMVHKIIEDVRMKGGREGRGSNSPLNSTPPSESTPNYTSS